MGFQYYAASGGPVTRAIRAVREPVSSGLTHEQALDNLRSGLDYFFGETTAADLASHMDADRSRLLALREAIASRLEAEFAILDAIDCDAELEAEFHTPEPAPGGGFYFRGRASDDEPADDNGVADPLGAWEQGFCGFDHDREIGR